MSRIADPDERADITSNTYYDWGMDHLFLIVPIQAYIVKFIETFKAFRPSSPSRCGRADHGSGNARARRRARSRAVTP